MKKYVRDEQKMVNLLLSLKAEVVRGGKLELSNIIFTISCFVDCISFH